VIVHWRHGLTSRGPDHHPSEGSKLPFPGDEMTKSGPWSYLAWLTGPTYFWPNISRHSARLFAQGRPAAYPDEEEGNTEMFDVDVAEQAENARVAEAGPAAGERALMRAVLEDAVHCLVGEVGPRRQRGQLAAEAREWIEAGDSRWPFSFENVCDALGFHAASLRG